MENVIPLVEYVWDDDARVWRWYVPITDRYGEIRGDKSKLIVQLQEEIKLINALYKSGKRRRYKRYKSA